MAIVTLKGSRVMTGLDASPIQLADIHEAGGRVRCWTETVEVGAADSATSTYLMARLPSGAVILPNSFLAWEDLASSGAPTLDVGVFNRSGKSVITDDPDALVANLDAAASGTPNVNFLARPTDAANIGKRLWEYVASQTTDPKDDLDIKVSLLDADVNVGGTITLVLFYLID